MTIPTALGDVRTANLHSRRIAFIYEHERLSVDSYLLDHDGTTGAYVVLAWCIDAANKWKLLRYSKIKGLEPVCHIVEIRRDFNPYQLQIALIDTQAFTVHRLHN
jgi:hypothetical protein